MRLYLYVANAKSLLEDNYNTGLAISSEKPEDYMMMPEWPLFAEAVVVDMMDNKTLKELALGQINEEEQKIRAVFEGQMQKLQNDKQRLMAIEHK